MIVHPNPMIEERGGYWHDTHLRLVRVEPRLLNRGNHRKRWIVMQKKGTAHEVISSHIMEAAAVVAAQRLANRLWMSTERCKKQRLNKGKKKNT
jgi:hypothetical protein